MLNIIWLNFLLSGKHTAIPYISTKHILLPFNTRKLLLLLVFAPNSYQ